MATKVNYVQKAMNAALAGGVDEFVHSQLNTLKDTWQDAYFMYVDPGFGMDVDYVHYALSWKAISHESTAAEYTIAVDVRASGEDAWTELKQSSHLSAIEGAGYDGADADEGITGYYSGELVAPFEVRLRSKETTATGRGLSIKFEPSVCGGVRVIGDIQGEV